VLFCSEARDTGDYGFVHYDDGRSSDDSSELSNFSESVSDLRADVQIQVVGESRWWVPSVVENLTEYAEDARAFEACIPTKLNLMDSISFDVASHVTFDNQARLDAEPAMEDEAFQGELWVDINSKGRAPRSPSSSTLNKYSKCRDMQIPAASNSPPKAPRIRAWNTASESDFLFPAGPTTSPSVGICDTAFNYLEITKQVDERIQAIFSGDRNAMVVLYQKVDHLKLSTKSSCGVPSQPGAKNLSHAKASQTRTCHSIQSMM
jgi:hypothetical protein